MPTHKLWEGREDIRARTQKEGEKWFNELAEQFKDLSPGTLVAINVDTGEFVTGIDQHRLVAEFKKRFGDHAGWVREIHEAQP